MKNLNEAKRYIKRYYIRPQNIFCSNKAEILQALVKEVGENNCSVYSLKSLDDHDDVHLLQPSDIIYYYDDGILYDKNHVKVMDYDLNVKHEEDRKKFGNVDAISDQTFDAEYEDRLTEAFERTVSFNEVVEALKKELKEVNDYVEIGYYYDDDFYGYQYGGTYCTVYKDDIDKYQVYYVDTDSDGDYRNEWGEDFESLEEVVTELMSHSWGDFFIGDSRGYYIIVEGLKESLDAFNEFNLNFTDVNVYGEKLYEGKATEFVCCICGEDCEGYGNNPSPIKETGKCCDACNRKFVLPARLNVAVE